MSVVAEIVLWVLFDVIWAVVKFVGTAVYEGLFGNGDDGRDEQDEQDERT